MKKNFYILFFLLSIQSFSQELNNKLDTVKTFYLDNLGKKQSCNLLLNKNDNQADQNLLLEIIDSFGKVQVLPPDQILGYWSNEIFYQSFKIFTKNKKLLLFAQELVTGKAELYLYNPEKSDSSAIYIFKKYPEKEYNFAKKELKPDNAVGLNAAGIPNADSTSAFPTFIEFYNEQSYLDYFQSYFMKCKELSTKIKTNGYKYTDVVKMFQDYNLCNQN
jgi:hypothetical protein